jgi:hypothetical protein
MIVLEMMNLFIVLLVALFPLVEMLALLFNDF